MGMSYNDLEHMQKAFNEIGTSVKCLFEEKDCKNNAISDEIIKKFYEINKPLNINYMELGNAWLKEKDEKCDSSLFEKGKNYRALPFKRFPAKKYFKSIGFSHVSIDLNGNDGALKYDLGRLDQGLDQFNSFDVVANFGTSEHVKNHYECFVNIHNFCKKGGIFIHAVPQTGFWYRHGACYRWYTPEFFENLCKLCNYNMIEAGVYGSPKFDYVKTYCIAQKPILTNNCDGRSNFISKDEFKALEKFVFLN